MSIEILEQIEELADKLLGTEKSDNRLMDLSGKNVFFIKDNSAQQLYDIIKAKVGKTAGVSLKGSATASEKILGEMKVLDWTDATGGKNTLELEAFRQKSVSEAASKGVNPLFLSIGAVKWKIPSKDGTKDVVTPVLIFPIKLVREGLHTTSPVNIEFIDDDAFFNPCLYYKMRTVFGEKFAEDFPLPNYNVDRTVDFKTFDIFAYFEQIKAYKLAVSSNSSGVVFDFTADISAIAFFNNDDICMYHDIRNNKKDMAMHPVISAILTKSNSAFNSDVPLNSPAFVLSYDKAQENIVQRAVGGESFVVKGPPGTGKTQTIVNMVAALLAEGKRVLVVSQKRSALSEFYNKTPEIIKPYLLCITHETESGAAKVKRGAEAIHGELQATLQHKTHGNPDELQAVRKRLKDDIIQTTIDIIGYNDLMFGKMLVYGLSKFNSGSADMASGIGYGSYYKVLNDACKTPNVKPVQFVEPALIPAISYSEYLEISSRVSRAASYLLRLTDSNKFDAVKNPWFGVKKDRAYDRNVSGVLAELAQRVSKLSTFIFDTARKNDISVDTLEKLNVSTLVVLALNDDITKVISALNTIPKAEEFARTLMNLSTELIENKPALEMLNTTLDEYSKLYTNKVAESEHNFNIAAAIFHAEILRKSDSVKELLALYDELKIFTKGKIPFSSSSGKTAFKSVQAMSREPKKLSVDTANKALAALSEYCIIKEDICALVDKINNVTGIAASENEIKNIINIKEKCAPFIKQTELLCERERLYSLYANVFFNDDDDCHKTASAVVAALDIRKKIYDCENWTEVAAKLAAIMKDAQNLDFIAAINDLNVHYKNNFASSIYSDPNKFTLNDLKIFANYALDNAQRDAAVSYFDAINGADFKLNLFFAPFENGERNDHLKHSFGEIFEHSYTSLLAGHIDESLADEVRHCSRDGITSRLSVLRESENKLLFANAEYVANACLERIDKNDSCFDFLKFANRYSALRRLFEKYSEAVRILKPCIIMSPSAVSMLLPSQNYSFDTVIIDEASQMPPENILSVVFRGTQCVIMGDEWQMPPIIRFKTDTDTDRQEEGMEAVKSALDLIRENASLPVLGLVSHFRSHTETLIAYSQKRYYPEMVTFPAPDAGIGGLGLYDVPLPDGFTENGANLAEAEETIKRIRTHFDKHYDTLSGRLNQTIGIITFGEKQKAAIESSIRIDKNLAKLISSARSADGEIAEKVFSVETIDRLQGQEFDHVIMSLTYGKRADKGGDGTVRQNFGELNKSVGERIFNVAVSRAKRSFTLIRSLEPSDITVDTLAYVREFIETVRKHDAGGMTTQFVSKSADGFIHAVATYIESLGISKERIVCNYGVTQNSVRVSVAILAEDLKRSELGIICESPYGHLDYVDTALRYPDILEARGWKLYRLYIFDWMQNNVFEKERLKKEIDKYVKYTKAD